MNTHFFGTLAVVRAFAPQLAAHGGGGILNVLSVLSWVSLPGSGAYCAAKSAEWSLTNALRQQLAGQNTQVTAPHVGYMDTDMARRVTSPKTDPAVVATLALDGLAAGRPARSHRRRDQPAGRAWPGRRGGRPLPSVRLITRAWPGVRRAWRRQGLTCPGAARARA